MPAQTPAHPHHPHHPHGHDHPHPHGPGPAAAAASPLPSTPPRHDLRPVQHSHSFADGDMKRRERAMTQVTLITLAAMVLEVVAGWWSGSLALLADGWHMGTHALALGGAVLAYRLSARAAGREGFAFGGWKIEVLTAYTSGLALAGAAAWIVVDAVQRLRQPETIAYREAIAVAVFGLVVNAVCAWLLVRSGGGHDHGHGHGHGHGHHHGHGDHNFSAAYLHVLADAFTSVLAIVALLGGLVFGWAWLDAAVALLGAAVIAQWSLGVLRQSANALVDATADPAISQRIRDLLQADGDTVVSDLHVWQVGAQAWTAAITVVADHPRPAADYRAQLAAIDTLRHVTVEVHACGGCDAPQTATEAGPAAASPG
jgi:cation diffusion facilitator family transporter